MAASLVRVDVKWDASALAARLGAARASALRETGRFILDRSRQRAPRQTGALIASARSEVAGDTVRVIYGAPYARMQHENLRYRHPNGGQARYLSSALEDPATAERAARLYAEALSGAPR